MKVLPCPVSTPPGSKRSTTTARGCRTTPGIWPTGPRPRRWPRAKRLPARPALRRRRGETLDVFPPPRPGAPVLVFIHGGYWRALDKCDFSFVAPAFTPAGAMVVVPNYALCPAVSVEHIALQMVRALAWVWRHAAQLRRRPAAHRRGRPLGRRPPGGDAAELPLEAGGRRPAGAAGGRRAVDLGPVRPGAAAPHALPADRPAAHAGVGARA